MTLTMPVPPQIKQWTGALFLWRHDRYSGNRPSRSRCAYGFAARMKFSTDRPYSDPEKAARKLLEIANTIEAIQEDGRIHIEKINAPMLYKEGASPAEYGAGLRFAIDKGWLLLHESGTYVKFTPAGAGLFA
ncbi:hypothetical protein [Bradyrhizobium sp. AUGA SZCCT0169]|jgi:hypothetical protein|uniref:hypothetical protein n=1 Tax=Bradyrhizobium sp. AUGA SZCCT0169 TaxID=2807663 RepID=UPI00289EBA94|nr:hypothetical protein [Bradyrhizobium sp. AUGA SZCCT0169]